MTARTLGHHGLAWIARLAAAAAFALVALPAQAEVFNETPARTIGSPPVAIGASITGQSGWQVNCTAANYDQDISHAEAHSGLQSWRVSNWFHQSCVNTVLTPAFPPIKEGGPGSRNHVEIGYWFYVPTGNAGTLVSSSLSDTPGNRLTYAAIRDDAGVLTVQAVGIVQGSNFLNTDPPPFDDPGVQYDIQSSTPLSHDTWYRLTVTADLSIGAQDDNVVYQVLDAGGATVWSSTNMPSWEDAYLAGAFGPANPNPIVADHVGFRIVENPDHLGTRLPEGYAATRPAGIYIDDLNVTPNISTGLTVGFEADRYVGPSGTDTGNCATATPATARCRTIAYALSQATPYNTIHVAAGLAYDLTSGPGAGAPLSVTQEGLRIVGDDPNFRPIITRSAVFGGSAKQPLLVIQGTTGPKNVHVENIEFDVDRSFAAEGILASGFVNGLTITNNHFVALNSNVGTAAPFGLRNAISINVGGGQNSLNLPRIDGSDVTITSNVIDGDVASGTLFRAGIATDACVGTISGNDSTSISHDIITRFATVTGASTNDAVVISGNVLRFGGLDVGSPNGGITGITVDQNNIFAPAFAATLPQQDSVEADFALVRLIGNQQNIPLTLSNNHFNDYENGFRGVLIENFPGVNLAHNFFLPANGATDFRSLVVSNKEIVSDNPPAAPYLMSITATDNLFEGNGIFGSGVGTAVEFLNDNNAGGATFGSLLFGNAGQENTFSGDLRWYFHLDNFNCSTNTTPVGPTPGGPGPLCTFLDYHDVGTIPNTEVRPFGGTVTAVNNLFAGAAPSVDPASVQAHTFDVAADPALGHVDYGTAATEAVVYVDDGFAGHNFGDPLTFTSVATGPQNVFFGINAFATIPDGLAQVIDGGTVYVAKGTFATATTIARPAVKIIGDGEGAADTVVTAGVVIAASGNSSVDPLLLQNLRIANTAGSGVNTSSGSHLAFDHVTFFGNGGEAGLDLVGTSDDILIDASTFDSNTGPGIRTSSGAQVSTVKINGSTFSNNGAGIILFGASGGGTGQITNWTVDSSHFLSNDNANANIFGGGIWIKTGGPGSAINGFTVSNSEFADNGSSHSLNQVGITIRARHDTTLTGVKICDDTFSDTATLGTQLTGINVVDEATSSTTGIYQPVEVCASNTFTGLGHSVSGLEQFTLHGTQPTVNITGGTIANTEYINGFVTRVRDSATFTTISAAMNDAATTDNDEIHAPAGLYHENVTFTHDGMTLTGDGPSTIIDGTGLIGSGVVMTGKQNIAVTQLAVRNFKLINTSEGACIFTANGSNGLTVTHTVISECRAGRGGIYVNAIGGISNITLSNNDISASDDRGIVLWNDAKTHVVIDSNTIHDIAGSGGIGFQDGTTSDVTVTNNIITNAGDAGVFLLGVNASAGPVLIANNQITASGRYGIQLLNPNGNGAVSGAGSVVVQGNTVTSSALPTNSDDVAGISIVRRYVSAGGVDVPNGVAVIGNTISGWKSSVARPGYEGFGIAIEGTAMNVSGNTLNNNDIGVQLQAGNDGYPGDSNQSLTNDFFARGNSPTTCVDLGTNTFGPSVIADSRSVSNPAGVSLEVVARNTTRGTQFCTIQGAINDVATVAGDTITVDAGNHPENVVVNKSVILQGAFAGTIGDDSARTGTGESTLNPPTGQALTLAADNAVFDGFTILSNAAVAVGPGGASRNNMQFINNRVVDIANGTGIRFEPGEGTPASGLVISGNLFSNIRGAGLNGVGVQLYKGTRTAVVSSNVFDGLQNIAIQINGGNGSVDGVTVSGNITRDTAALGDANNALVVTNADNVVVKDNTFDKIATGLFLSDNDTGISATCNTLTASNRGVSSSDFFGGIPNTGISILDNAITGASADLRNGMAQNLIIGSNWYDNAPPSTDGTGLLVADALAANPIGNAQCGNNAAFAVVATSGTPQSTTVNTAFGQPLVARVTDVLGGAVANSALGFAAPSSGASANLSASSATTDYNGSASVNATANAFAGSYNVTASDGSASGTFALTNNAGTGVFLDLNGPVSNVQQNVPTAYTGHIVNTGAALTENAVVHLAISSNRAGGVQANDVVAEFNVGAGWQALPLALTGGALQADYGAPSGFAVPAGFDVTTNFRFTFTHADSPNTTCTGTASLVGVTSHTVYSTDTLATQVVPATTNVSLSINGPTSSHVGVATPYTTRITNTGSPTPDNVVVKFMIGRAGGIDPGDITMDSGITLSPCLANPAMLCGTFGAPGFPVPNGFDMSQTINVTSHRSGNYSVSSTVEGVTSGTTYATASFLVAAGASGVTVDLDGPAQGVEIGNSALYTVRLDNPSTDPLSQPAVFAFEITDAPATIAPANVFSLEFDDGSGSGFQPVTASVAPGPNGGLAYVFDHAGAGYPVAAASTFVGHVRVHFATATTYQLRLGATGTGSPAEIYGNDEVDTAVITPTQDITFDVSGPVQGVEVGNDTVYVGHLRNAGDVLPEQAHTQFCIALNGNPATAADLGGSIDFTGSGGTFTAPLALDGSGCATLGDETLVSGYDQTATFTLNFATPGSYVMTGELIGATTSTVYAALNQSTLVTAPTGGRTVSIDGPLSGVGVGAATAYIAAYDNGGSMIPGNQEFRVCVARNSVPAGSGDVDVAYDLDGSGSYANALTLGVDGCGVIDTLHSAGGDAIEAELQYTYHHVGTYVSTASVRSALNPATVYASDTATTAVGQGDALVTIDPASLNQAYDGTQKSVTVNTVPAGLTVDKAYNGSSTAPSAAGSYAVVATVNDPDWTGSASGTLVISDTAGISLGLAGPASAAATQPAGAWTQGYISTVNNTGGLTSQPVHYLISAVRIDDNNADPIAATDIDGCIEIGNGFAGDCDSGYFSLMFGKTTGVVDGRAAVLFRYPNVPANDLPLPNTAGPLPVPSEFRFAPGEYRLVTQVIGSTDGTVYATSSSLVTTVADAHIALNGSFTGQAEQSLLSTTTLTNDGGPLPENALVRITLHSNAGALAPADAEFAYQLGASYATLPWTATGGDLVALFGPQPGGFAIPDGYNQTTGGRAIFHRTGSFDLTFEVLDAATLTTLYASDTHTLTISAESVAITLSDLTQTYDGTARAVTVTTVPAIPSAAVDVQYTGTGSTVYGPSATPPTHAGSYAVSATATGTYSGSATGTLTVNKASAVVTIDPASLSATFDGQPHAATVTVNPAVSFTVTYDGSATPPTNVGSYIVVATVTDPDYQGSAIDVLTIDPSAAGIDFVADPVGAVTTAASAPVYSLSSGTTHLTGTPPAENVIAHLVVSHDGGAAVSDLDIDYLAATQESVSCVPATPTGFWCPLSLTQNLDGTLGANFGPTTGFPLTDGATSRFRTRYHSGGHYDVAVAIDGVGSLQTYASGTFAVEVADLTLTPSGPATAATGVPADSSVTLTNTGTAGLDAATAASPNNENVLGQFAIGLAAGSLAVGDVTVSYLAPDNAYHDIPLAACAADPNQLCGSFGPGTGFPVAAGYNATSLFRTLFTVDGSYTFTTDIVGVTSGAVFAESAQTINVGASSANIAIDAASLAQTYNGGTHPVIVTTTPDGLSYTLTYDDGAGPVATPPTNAGSYAVVATITQAGYSGMATGTLVVAKAAGTVTFGPTNFTYDGLPHATTAFITQEPATTCALTYSSGAAPVDAGTYTVDASCTGSNYDAAATTTLVISQGAVGITLNQPLNVVFDGNAHAVTATTLPAGVAYGVTYAGSGATVYPLTTVAPSAAGTYAVTAMTADPNYTTAIANGTLTISNTLSIHVDSAAPVGTVALTPEPDADAKKSHYMFTLHGASPGENVVIHFATARDGGVQAGDLALEYSLDSGNTWQALPLTLSGGMLVGTYNPDPVNGIPVIDGESAEFRATFARGGHYSTTATVDGFTSGVSYTTSVPVVTDVADLALAASGAGVGTVGAPVDSAMALHNSGTAALSDTQPAPNDENVVGKFAIALDDLGPVTLAAGDVTVSYLDTLSNTYQSIPLATCAADPAQLCGSFGPPTGFPVSAGYDATTLFRSEFLKLGTWTVTTQIVGHTSATVYAETMQAVGIDTGAAEHIALVSGSGQSATVAQAFAAPLVVSVTDAGGNPVAGAMVNFAAPASGASLATPSFVVATDINGFASTPVIANHIAGGYGVTAGIGNGQSVGFSLTNTADADPAQIVLVTSGGTPQTATLNHAFGLPLAAHVADRFGNALAGQTVDYAAPGSGATASLGAPSATTDANGDASVTATANGTPGSYAVDATIAGVTATASYALTNTTAAATALAIQSGDGQHATVLSAYGAALVAKVTDANNDPVEGVSVTFAAPASGATVSFASQGTAVAITDANGLATSPIPTAGSTAGSVDVVATASGANGPLTATFHLVNDLGGAVAVQIVSGDHQTATIGTPFGQPLVVRIVDAGGNTLSGGTVTFAAPLGGPSATLTAPVQNPDGSWQVNATANGLPGGFTITASDGTHAASFTLTNVIANAASIAAVSGTGQSAVILQNYGAALVAVVKDAGGVPVQGVSVTFAAPGSGASASFAGQGAFVAVTDSNGLATAPAPTANAIAGGFQVTATMAGPAGALGTSFALTNLPSAAAAIVIDAGTLAATYDGSAHAVTATTTPAGLAYSVTYDGSATPPTDAGSYAVVATITDPNYAGSPAANGTLVIAKGVGTVTFGATNFTFDGAAHATTAVITQESGDAGACTLTYTPTTVIEAGTYQVDATCTGTNYDASASTTLVIAPKLVTIVLAGTGSFVYDGSPHTATASVTGEEGGFPATVDVTYDGGASAPSNVGVYDVVAALDAVSTNYTAVPASGSIAITPAIATVTLSNLVQTYDGSPRPVTVTTVPASLAVIVTYDGSATVPSAVGIYAVAAEVDDPNYVGSASDTLQIVPGAADVIAVNGSTTFSGTAGQPLAGALPSVLVTDGGGNPVSGATVTFATTGDSGVLSGAVQITGSDGIATLGGWTLSANQGPNTVVASAAGISGSVTFTATGAADTGQLSVTMTDLHDYVQVSHIETYTITIANATSSNVSGADVSDLLPPGLDVASAEWQCIPINGATCAATGTGNLIDTIDLPSGSSLVYLLSARVNPGPGDVLINTIDVTVGGNTVSASDSSIMVVFRSGFEVGGDGGDDAMPGRPAGTLAGTLDADHGVAINVAGLMPSGITTLAVANAAGQPVARVEGVGINGTLWVRLRVQGPAAGEIASRWTPVDPARPQLAFALVADSHGSGQLVLTGATQDLALPIAGATTYTIYTAARSGN